MDQNLEERVVDTTQAERQKGKRIIKNEDGLRDFWDNIRHINICIMGGLKRRREREI